MESVRTLNLLVAQKTSIVQQITGAVGPQGPTGSSTPLTGGEVLLSEMKILNSSQNVFQFTGIAQDYTHLKLKGYVRNDRPMPFISTSAYLSLNGNTGSALYRFSQLFDNSEIIGSTSDGAPLTNGSNNTGANLAIPTANLGDDANMRVVIGQFECFIPHYSVTGIKQIIVKNYTNLVADRASGSAKMYINVIHYMPNPISSVNFLIPFDAYFTTGSTLQLFGLR